MEQSTERRVEELGLEGFRSDFLALERRADDLEEVLAKVLSALAAAETREERVEALRLLDEIPTMRVHRERFSEK